MTVLVLLSVLALGLVVGVPIAVSLGLAGAVGMILIYGGISHGSIAVAQTVASAMENFVLAAIPLYMLMAQLMIHSGLAQDLFDLADRCVRRVPGGLVIATILSSGVFAATSGSSAATVSTVGGVALPELERRGVDRRLGIGAVACAGSLGILIPPSVIFILYGVATQTSIADLFIAGIGPGVLLVVLMSGYVVVREVLRPGRATTSAALNRRGKTGARRAYSGVGGLGARDMGRRSETASLTASVAPGGQADASATMKEPPRKRSPYGFIPSVAVVPLILVLIYTGVATPTEAAGIGVVYALIVGIVRRGLDWMTLRASLAGSVSSGAMVLAIVAGASVFAKAMSLARVPQDFTVFIGDLGLGKVAFVITAMVAFLVLGMFLDATSIVLIVVPILLPILIALDIDLIWFGVLLVINMEIGAVTPPLGVNLFIVKGVLPSVPMREILRSVVPFVTMQLVGLVVVACVPAVALFLVEARA